LEAGSALEYDLAWLGGIIANRPGGNQARPLFEQLVIVPEQYRYPASFLAIIGFVDPADQRPSRDVWTEVLALTKASQTAPWRIELEAPTWDPVWTLGNTLGVRGGETYAPMSSDTLLIDPGSIQQRWTDRRGWVPETTSAGRVYRAGLAGGAQLVCFSQDFQQVNNQPWWRAEHVGPKDVRQIPPGYYRSTDARRVIELCVVDPPVNGANEEVKHVAARKTITAHSEVPASQPPWFLIGIGGLLGLGLLGVIAMLLKPGQPANRLVLPVRWNEIERDTAVHGATVILVWALILVEVERWALNASLPLALLLAVVPALWVLVMLPSPLRTITVTVRARVNRKPEELFPLIADPRNHRLWEAKLEMVEACSEGPPGVGMHFRERQRLADGRRAETETVITEYEPNRRFATQTVGFWHPQRFRWTFEPRDAGDSLVTSTVRLRVGPLYAISGRLLNRGRLVGIVKQHRTAEVRRLLQHLSGVKQEPGQPAPPTGDIPRLYAWMRRHPTIFKFGLGLSTVTFLASLVLYTGLSWFWPGPWFGPGFLALILVHEMGHYLYGRHARLAPDPPVFVGFAAFVAAKKKPSEGLTNARFAAAGAFLASLAIAGLVALYGLTGFMPFLAWALGGALINLMGSLLPFEGTDGIHVIAAFARWLPLFGVVFGLALFGALASLGYVIPLVPVIGFLAVLALSQRYSTNHLALYWRLTPLARLMLGTTSLAMICYLAGVAFLAANWL
jgi:hypothetical protein